MGDFEELAKKAGELRQQQDEVNKRLIDELGYDLFGSRLREVDGGCDGDTCYADFHERFRQVQDATGLSVEELKERLIQSIEGIGGSESNSG